eukprot:jgi/Mesvir1/26263/Mv01626-RA.1
MTTTSKRYADELDAARRRVDARWARMCARQEARNPYPFRISFNREYMESCPSYRGKTPLTAEELAVVQSGDVSPLTRWSAAALPADGWVSCILCDGLMPSQKVELTLRVPTGFAFYHADCFDSSVHRRLDTRLPCRDREASEEEGDKDEDEVIPSQVQWDLDKPDGGEY